MNLLATVLYEDKMQVGSGGAFPPHDLILAMVGDVVGRTVWELRELIGKNPRNGVNKLIADLGRTDLLAGPGVLCVLVDRDRVAEHVGLPKTASDAQVTDALRKRSDAPAKLGVFFVDPNIEGLMKAIAECEPSLPAPMTKGHNSRDIHLNKAAFSSPSSLRDCVKGKQPSVAALVSMLAELCNRAA